MSIPRRVAYITGTRADFGLMQSTLQAIHASPRLQLGVIVTGMHLDENLGGTVREVAAAGLKIIATVPVEPGTPTGALMARNIAAMLRGFVGALETYDPDCVLVLGDRGEMLAAAIAGGHMSIPVIHIHGGERSGTIDESVRHAISKLSHFHLVATEESRDRLIRMGEVPETIRVIGAPGLDGLEELASHSRPELHAKLGLATDAAVALLVYHPVLQEAEAAAKQAEIVLDALLSSGMAIVALKPNSDAGSRGILDVLEAHAAAGRIKLVSHLSRDEYLSMLRHASILIGNSSSGIIEAASFGTPVVNVGSRQNFRQRNSNVIDVSADGSAIVSAIEEARKMGRQPIGNVYGDGRAGRRIVELLETLSLPGNLLSKVNGY